MHAEDRLALAEAVLARSRADATEVTVIATHQALSRFTHETIHQNVDEADVLVQVRAIADGRAGIATTNVRDDAALDDVVRRAAEIASFAPRESIPPVVASEADAGTPAGAYVARTAHAAADERARIADAIFAHARAGGLWSAGYVKNEDEGITIATSAGARMSFAGTAAGANVKMNGPDATGFAERYATDIAALDGDAIGARAARKAAAARAPLAVEPGDWTVILEPAAFGELLAFFSGYFSAEAYTEGSSYLSGRLGECVAGTNVTIRDDFAHPLNPGMPFDFAGVPTQRLALIERGVAANIVTDQTWAQRLGCPDTGHSVPRGASSGPQPLHLVVDPGTRSYDDLIAATKRGLLVTRFWYVRYVDQRRSIVTGMTRDGTFLIENGVVSRGVHNMRFNVAIGDLLGACDVGSDQARTGSYGYSLVTPSVAFERFHFASVASY
jgi:PmbA protein